MADLAASAVTILDSWTEGGNNGKKLNVYKCSATFTAMGTATNKLLATAFRLIQIERVSPFVADDNSLVIAAAPNVAGTLILLKAAGSNAPADYTDTFYFTVWGYPPQS